MKRPILLDMICLVLLGACGRSGSDQFEVLERNEKQMLNGKGASSTGMEYVLLHDGHKIHARCNSDWFASEDPTNSCRFLVMRTYSCVPGRDSMNNGDPWDLKCKDADGHNVYLEVSKKE